MSKYLFETLLPHLLRKCWTYTGIKQYAIIAVKYQLQYAYLLTVIHIVFGLFITGRSIEVTNDGNGVSFDCNNVFENNTKVDVFYDVMVGSAQGFADIVDRHSLPVCSVTFQVPTYTIISADIKEIFINIEAAYSTGMRHTYRTSYKLP